MELLEYGFVSWFQFLIIAGIGLIMLLVVHRFHLFDQHSWKSSIGYHMFFCVVSAIIVIVFVAVRPFFHLAILLIVFGLIFKNIFAYVRSIFTLYFSKVHIGDQIKIGDARGVLTNINLGGMHVSSHNEKSYYPFSNWTSDKIVLLSEAGKVSFSLIVDDLESRSKKEGLIALEKSLFRFPYLANEKVEITSSEGKLILKAMVSTKLKQESIKANIQKAGFSINELNSK